MKVQNLTAFMDAASPIILTALREFAPKKTGAMAAAQHYHRVAGADAKGPFVQSTFEGPHDPTEWVIHGTYPHEIAPHHPPHFLHWQEGGTHHFRRLVHHPGQLKNDFPRVAYESVKPLVQQLFKDTVVH
jgi:hypothetical protein